LQSTMKTGGSTRPRRPGWPSDKAAGIRYGLLVCIKQAGSDTTATARTSLLSEGGCWSDSTSGGWSRAGGGGCVCGDSLQVVNEITSGKAFRRSQHEEK